VTLSKVREMKSDIVTRMTRQLLAKSSANDGKPTKVARVVAPAAEITKSYSAETTGRSITSTTDLALKDDFTREIDLQQPMTFTTGIELNQRTASQQRTTAPRGVFIESDDGFTVEPSQSLPPLFFNEPSQQPDLSQGLEARQPACTVSKPQPAGILKNSKSTQRTTFTYDEQDTGRFSVKSGVSVMSLLSNASVTNMIQRPISPPGHAEDVTREDNMTSALFVDDITINTRKETQATKSRKRTIIPVLSKTAQRVLANLCDDHDCGNCNVCRRINSHAHKSTQPEEGKAVIRVGKPVPVTDRIPNTTATASSSAAYEDAPTIRPSSNPAVALATVMKGLKDEEKHIIAILNKAQSAYASLDASYGRKQRKTLRDEMQRLTRELDVKRDQIYLLHDVLEGQKASGEEMTSDFVECTIHSIMGKEETWNGFQA